MNAAREIVKKFVNEYADGQPLPHPVTVTRQRDDGPSTGVPLSRSDVVRTVPSPRPLSIARHSSTHITDTGSCYQPSPAYYLSPSLPSPGSRTSASSGGSPRRCYGTPPRSLHFGRPSATASSRSSRPQSLSTGGGGRRVRATTTSPSWRARTGQCGDSIRTTFLSDAL